MKDKKIKSNSNSGIYTGKVKLTLKKGKSAYKVVNQHNAGTVEFFMYILNSLKGDILPNDRPSHIKLVYEDYTSRYGVIYESVDSAKNVGTADNPLARITYHFLIPETIVEQGTIIGLQLESLKGVKYAYVDLSEPVEITSNTNIELDWELNISNK